ncbi:MAG: DUF3570 domain-containing protein [Chlorobiales bacterium]|nr:DUF3570 domain-containing protein [Chlorobiales bacterium]
MKSDTTIKTNVIGAAIFAAAMTLPSYHSAFAEAVPEHGIVSFKYLNYQDSQPDQERISVNAYSVMAMAPIGGKWSISTTYTNDSVSGASPEYHSHIVSGASAIKENRQAVDLSVTRYYAKGTLTLGSSYSSENDYISRSYSVQESISTEDKNTTFAFGGSYTTDTINPSNDKTSFYDKSVAAALVGVTKVLTKQDIVQLNFGYSKGNGYYSDPYKLYDERPDKRESKTVMTRWNHHYEGTDGTTRLSYRYYTDTFGINAHTVGIEYVQPLPHEWTVTPLVRFYSQTAANFYLPYLPVPGTTLPSYYSLDQRLSAFGALSVGIKIEKKIAKDWLVDAKFEDYKQRAGWCITGGGDQGLAPFNARSFQLGLSRVF